MQVERPLWVRFGVWGVPNRATAWVLVWVNMVLSVAFVAFGYVDRIYAFGALFILCSIGYFSVIRWMDKHRQW